MDKIERLIQMMDQPGRYSEKEWQDVLSDKDCQEYYRLMCDANAVLNTQHVPERLRPDELETEEALQRFEHRHLRKYRPVKLWHQVAAAFSGLVLVSGITFATVVIVRQHRPVTQKETVVKSAQRTVKAKTATARRDTVKIQPQSSTDVKQFVNVSVGTILHEIASYYRMEVEVHDEQASRIRLYFNWNKQYNAAQVAGQLDQFDHIHVTLEGGKFVLESKGGTN